MIINNESMLSARENIMKLMFDSEFADLKDVINELEKDNDVNETNKNLTNIKWDDSDFEGKTLEEKEFICKYRAFLQDIFNEYQIRSVHILSTETKKAKENNLTDEGMEKNLSNAYASLLINMFIKCGNWGYNEASNYVSTNYKVEINKFEDSYMNTLKRLNEQETQLSEQTKKIDESELNTESLKKTNENLSFKVKELESTIDKLNTELAEVTQYKDELNITVENLKNKKFLGMFKLNK